MSVTTSPELLVARRAASGHEDSWRELVDRHGRKIYNLAFHLAGPEQAEDLTQEIFLRLWRNLGKYRGDVPFAGWALKLSRNLCIDHLRRSRRQVQTIGLTPELDAWLPADEAGPLRRAQRREDERQLYRALASLPEELAEPILLFDIQGLKYDEIATFLDLPMGTIKSRLHRGRKLLARELVDARTQEGGS